MATAASSSSALMGLLFILSVLSLWRRLIDAASISPIWLWLRSRKVNDRSCWPPERKPMSVKSLCDTSKWDSDVRRSKAPGSIVSILLSWRYRPIISDVAGKAPISLMPLLLLFNNWPRRLFWWSFKRGQSMNNSDSDWQISEITAAGDWHVTVVQTTSKIVSWINSDMFTESQAVARRLVTALRVKLTTLWNDDVQRSTERNL